MSGVPPLKISMIGNAHVDPAWMWQRAEGMEAFAATCRSAVQRIQEHDEVIFTCSTAAQYAWLEKNEPALFAEIVGLVRRRRWEIVGGWWTEADCNLPSGEGMIRQALIGMRFFLERFGSVPSVGYSPDAFGHGGGLPQILKESGLTEYIFCRPDPDELPLPSPLFHWLPSTSGAVPIADCGVLAYRVPFHYNMYLTSVPKKVSDLLHAYYGRSSQSEAPRGLGELRQEWALFYGIGNHGGGPTREHLRQIDAIAEGDRSEILTPGEFSIGYSRLDDFLSSARGEKLPEVVGGLHLNSPGCYSSAASIKGPNRRVEHRLLRAERLARLAAVATGVAIDSTEALREAWNRICFNHFHDLLCGVAIVPALQEAIDSYGAAAEIAREVEDHAIHAIARHLDTTGDGETLLLLNPNLSEFSGVHTFELWHDIDKSLWSEPIDLDVRDEEGKPLTVQQTEPRGKIGRDRIAAMIEATVPPLGWRTLKVRYGSPSAGGHSDAIAGDAALDNGSLRWDWGDGDAAGLYLEGHRFTRAPSPIRFLVIEDPFDTWGHGASNFDRLLGTFEMERRELLENGPLRARVRETWRWGTSRIEVVYSLSKDSRGLDFNCRIVWNERRAMLKVGIPLAFESSEGIVESFYSADRFASDGIERPGGQWKVAVGADLGLGVIDDLTHGCSFLSEELRLSVLRCVPAATHDPHPESALEDREYLDLGVTEFAGQIVPLADLNDISTLPRAAERHLSPVITRLESPHPSSGETPGDNTWSGITTLPGNVYMPVLKEAENGSGHVIRLVETAGRSTVVDVEVLGHRVNAHLEAFEVGTFLLQQGDTVRILATELPANPSKSR